MRSATAASSRAGRRPSKRGHGGCSDVRATATCCSCSAPGTWTAPWGCSVAELEERVAVARFTTIGTGGAARWFARPGTVAELQEALAWADANGVPVEVIGLGSNLLVHDDGVDALVLKLVGELAAARIDADVLVAGGGAPNAVSLHRARAAGLGGFEFACAIPGTAGGGVRMNAGAYGGDWAGILERALVVDAEGARWHARDELGLRYRRS